MSMIILVLIEDELFTLFFSVLSLRYNILLFSVLHCFCGLILIYESVIIIRSSYPVEVSIHTDWYDHYGVGLFFSFHKCYPRFAL